MGARPGGRSPLNSGSEQHGQSMELSLAICACRQDEWNNVAQGALRNSCPLPPMCKGVEQS